MTERRFHSRWERSTPPAGLTRSLRVGWHGIAWDVLATDPHALVFPAQAREADCHFRLRTGTKCNTGMCKISSLKDLKRIFTDGSTRDTFQRSIATDRALELMSRKELA